MIVAIINPYRSSRIKRTAMRISICLNKTNKGSKIWVSVYLDKNSNETIIHRTESDPYYRNSSQAVLRSSMKTRARRIKRCNLVSRQARRLARRRTRSCHNIDSKRQKAAIASGAAAAKAECEPKRFVREFRGSVEGVEVGQNTDVELSTTFLRSTLRRPARARYFWRYEASFLLDNTLRTGVKNTTVTLAAPATARLRACRKTKMPGRYGNARCTVRNQKVVVVDKK